MTDIKPALTPEEWAWAKQAGFPNVTTDIRAAHGTHLLLEGPPFGLRDHTTTEQKGDVHRIIALALHGQPFGFTWEDVDRLRSAADVSEMDEDALLAGQEPSHPWMRELAHRIAALLPPRP